MAYEKRNEDKDKNKKVDPNNPPMNPEGGDDNIKRKKNLEIDPEKHPSKK